MARIDLNLPGLDFGVLRAPKNMAQIANRGFAGYEEGTRLRDLIEASKRDRVLRKNLRGLVSGGNIFDEQNRNAIFSELLQSGEPLQALDRAYKFQSLSDTEKERTRKKDEETKKAEREQKMRLSALTLQSLPENERAGAAQRLFAELDPERFAAKLAFPQGEDELKPQDIFSQENQLRNQYEGLTKDFRIVRDAYARIGASSKDPSAAGDLALIFSYMKILDPGSTVRGGEFANAQNSGGVDDRIRSVYNNVLRGERLSEAQRFDFVNRSKSLYSASERQYLKTNRDYRKLAGSYPGLKPERVAIDYLMAPDVDEFLEGYK